MKYSLVLESIYEAGWISLMRANPRSTEWYVLKLDCGHVVGRYAKGLEEAPKKVKCEYCHKNEKAIQKNYDYTSDSEGFERNQSNGEPIIRK